MRKHYVAFLAPGTFISERTEKVIESWSVAEAVNLAAGITERYNAKPYGFYFFTVLAHEPVPDGEGGTLDVQVKEVARSGMYFLGGKVRTLDHVERFAGAGESILLSNMRSNGMWVVITNANSFRVTQPFEANDVVVDPATGAILRRGDEPELVGYRAGKDLAREQELSSLTSRTESRP